MCKPFRRPQISYMTCIFLIWKEAILIAADRDESGEGRRRGTLKAIAIRSWVMKINAKSPWCAYSSFDQQTCHRIKTPKSSFRYVCSALESVFTHICQGNFSLIRILQLPWNHEVWDQADHFLLGPHLSPFPEASTHEHTGYHHLNPLLYSLTNQFPESLPFLKGRWS